MPSSEAEVWVAVATMTCRSPNAAGLGAYIDAVRDPEGDELARWSAVVLEGRDGRVDDAIGLLAGAFELWIEARLTGYFRS